MAVSLYTKMTKKDLEETQNEDRSLLQRKPPELCVGFTPAKSKMLQIKA